MSIGERKRLRQEAFRSATAKQKEAVMEIVGDYHYRNGKENHDGSLGRIEITPQELNDVLAYCLCVREDSD